MQGLIGGLLVAIKPDGVIASLCILFMNRGLEGSGNSGLSRKSYRESDQREFIKATLKQFCVSQTLLAVHKKPNIGGCRLGFTFHQVPCLNIGR